MSPACLPGVQSSGTEGHAEQRRTVVTPLLRVCVPRGCGGVGTGGGEQPRGTAVVKVMIAGGTWSGGEDSLPLCDERGRH